MDLKNQIYHLRTDAKLSQEQFAALFQVSRQAVQKWESGAAVPDLAKLIEISKHFDISLDALILNHDTRTVETFRYNRRMQPHYANLHDWEFYTSGILTEYQQSLEEGLDIEVYQTLFEAAARLPKNEIKKKLGDLLFEIILHAEVKEGYPYLEPSDLETIHTLRRPHILHGNADTKKLADKIHGAWLGRICGCMLGKTVEGMRTNELIPFLKQTGNYPMHRYILRSDLSDAICQKYTFPLAQRSYADEICAMPPDDDTNYTVLAQHLIENFGRDFTPYDVSRVWLSCQGKDAYCTAERVAYCNFINGFEPPHSALYKNPYREWIGAQIRGDYFGYINPGNPSLAAEMAWRDASISHIKNGIYGEMFIAAMLAAAAVTDNIEDTILSGLAEIPYTSRLYASISSVLEDFRKGVSQKDCLDRIHAQFDEYSAHGWCHTISNAMIVVAALLYGNGNFGKSICMAVETGFDTDCNGATVGSILGMIYGAAAIPSEWSSPFHNTLQTTIFGIGTVKISECAQKTLTHVLPHLS